MRIGIVTLFLHANYGGILQAYALAEVLRRMGHDAVQLQPYPYYRHAHSPLVMPLVWCKRAYRRYLGGEDDLPIFSHPTALIRRNTDRFIRKHIPMKYVKEAEWDAALAAEFDAIVVGSDQVWRPEYAQPLNRHFADFAAGSSARIVSYAASFGTDKPTISDEKADELAPLVRRYAAVSVREASAVDICRRMVSVDAEHVIDPTMLLERSHYEALAAKAPHSPGCLMCYVLDKSPSTEAFIGSISAATGLAPFRANSNYDMPEAPLKQRQQPPVEHWLRGFADARMVITDSFHACVFSILFNVPFLCIGNANRGMSRFHSLLEMFGLTERLVDLTDFDHACEVASKPIDWEKVNEALALQRRHAMQFLSEALTVPL